MISPDELAALLGDALQMAGEAEAEISAHWAERGFARFAVGELGQHMFLSEPIANVRVARGQRVAEVSTTRLDREGLVLALQTAAGMLAEVPPDEDFAGFTNADEPAPPVLKQYAASTATCTAEQRVDLLEPVLGAIAQAGLIATGVLDTARAVEAVATTGGLVRSHQKTLASFKVWALQSAGGGGAAGHGLCAHQDVTALDLMAQTQRAIADALDSRNPMALDAGRYDVVLEPPAVAELMEWLAMIAFSAEQLHQGTSPLAGRLGERISGEALSVAEDPLSSLSFATPFDREGVARRRVPLIDRGIARGVLYDRTWARRLGAKSTGSASAGGRFGDGGPQASALVLEGGSAGGVDELVGGIERGLLIRRLHYVNGMLEPRRAVMTGLTRDGTFLVENGKRTRGVGNLRFTDSLLEAFERCDGATQALQVVPNWWSESGSGAAPAVRIRGLRFSGGSQRQPEPPTTPTGIT